MVHCEYQVLAQILSQIQQIYQLLSFNEDLQQSTVNENNILSSIILITSKIAKYIQNNRSINLAQSQEQDYELIEKQLQRQQGLNRTFIKKQMQFKEYQKCLMDELNDERIKSKKLQIQLYKINQLLQNKELEIQHLNNQKRLIGKSKRMRDDLTMETLINQKKIEGVKTIQRENGFNLQFTHQRRKSDDLNKRPSTGNPKKKGSVTKR